MMKKIVLLISVLLMNLIAQEIHFNMATPSPKRIQPNSTNEILSFNEALKDAMHSIVNISTSKHLRIQSSSNLAMDPLFQQFFGPMYRQQVPRERMQRALGSGVILSEDGYIVTNAHVINNADEITVTLKDQSREYPAKLIGQDIESDLAVIKIDAKNLKPIKLGYAEDLKIGDIVFAIGNPFGIGETVTQGIISALNKNRMGINQYENFIQTDASINPGNSGGALVDSRGALIGINSVIISRSGGNNGIGFAIPVDMVKNVVKKLIEEGKVSRGYLGVSISDLTSKLRPLYNHKKGAVIVDVEPEGPAEQYGLRRGDLVWKINDKKVKNAADLKRIVASYKPGEKVTLSVERDKKEIDVEVKLGSREALIAAARGGKILGGLYLSDLDPKNRYNYRIAPNIEGVLIQDIAPGSEGEKVGFQAGDVIIQIEDIPIKNLRDLAKALNRYPDGPKRIYVNRYGAVLMFVIQ